MKKIIKIEWDMKSAIVDEKNIKSALESYFNLTGGQPKMKFKVTKLHTSPHTPAALRRFSK